MRTPGRPSRVSLAGTTRSMPASQPQAITEVAKPVKERAASIAHFSESAVTWMAVPLIGNASAKVSSMTTPLRVIAVDGASCVTSGMASP